MSTLRVGVRVVAGASLVLVVLSACSGSGGSPLAALLSHLRAQNGLYARPGAGNDIADDLFSSAYGLTVLHLAGGAPAAPWTVPQARQTAMRATGQDSVFGPWAVDLVDAATGAAGTASGQAVLSSLTPEGFFSDLPAAPTDTATRLASTNAALTVLAGHHVALRRDQTLSIATWLATNASQVQNPYQACQLLGAARIAGAAVDSGVAQSVITRWEGAAPAAETLHSEEDVLDAYGDVCVRGLLPSPRPAVLTRDSVRPYLTKPASPSVAYHLSLIWTALHGDAAALRPLASQMQARVNAATHLLQSDVTITGTVDTSYDVVALRRAVGLPSEDKALVRAIRRIRQQEPPDPSGLQNLLAASVLHDAGVGDGTAERAAAQRALAAAPHNVDESNVGTWSRLCQLLNDLGLPPPRGVTLEPWPTTSALSRFSAWTALAMPRQVTAGPADSAFPGLLDATAGLLLKQGHTLSMKELGAATGALHAGSRPVPAAAVQAALRDLRGCPDMPDLYRPAPSATDCDVSATLSARHLLELLPDTMDRG